MDRGYFGPTDRKNGYMGMFDNGFPPVAAAVANASLDMTEPHSPDAERPMGVFECARRSWSSVMALPYVYGNFAWTGMDYKGETTLGWPDVNSHYGIHDMAGFAKDSVGYYEAWWRDADACTGISISPSEWTAPVAIGTPINVHVTTCAAYASLYINGVLQSPGKAKMDRFGFLAWSVPFKPGNITAYGYDSAGNELSSKTIASAKAPKQLKLTVDAPYNGRNASQLTADGQDVVLLRAVLLDSDGIAVPNADVNVSFEIVTGPATVIGVANGDPADHSPDKGTWRRTFHGLARGIVASSKVGATGQIVVKASSPGIQSGKVVLEAA